VLGVVAAPALGLTYYAAADVGAFRREDGSTAAEPIHVRPAADPLVVVGSRSHRGDSLDGLLARLGAHEMRPMGSALKFCVVAEGAADFYPRLGPTSEWDTAAAQAVVECAGGAVTTAGSSGAQTHCSGSPLPTAGPGISAVGPRARSMRWRISKRQLGCAAIVKTSVRKPSIRSSTR